MNKEKQIIEDMAKHCHFCEKGKCLLLGGEMVDCDMECDMGEFAKSLYNANYRKQSEGEWIRKDGFQVCSNCDATKPIAFSTVLKITYYKCDYCPKCGAKMKGGAE